MESKHLWDKTCGSFKPVIKTIILWVICRDYSYLVAHREPPQATVEYSGHEVASNFDDLGRGGADLQRIKSDWDKLHNGFGPSAHQETSLHEKTAGRVAVGKLFPHRIRTNQRSRRRHLPTGWYTGWWMTHLKYSTSINHFPPVFAFVQDGV